MRTSAIVVIAVLCGLSVTATADHHSGSLQQAGDPASAKPPAELINELMAAKRVAAVASKSADNALARVPLSDVLKHISGKTGHRYLIEEQVPSKITLGGLPLNAMDESDFMHILAMNGLATVRSGNTVRVISEVNVRQRATRLVDGTEDDLLDSQWVTYVMPLDLKEPTTIVPVLRPLMSQHGHMAVLKETGDLLLVDRWEHIRRLKAIVHAITSKQ